MAIQRQAMFTAVGGGKLQEHNGECRRRRRSTPHATTTRRLTTATHSPEQQQREPTKAVITEVGPHFHWDLTSMLGPPGWTPTAAATRGEIAFCAYRKRNEMRRTDPLPLRSSVMERSRVKPILGNTKPHKNVTVKGKTPLFGLNDTLVLQFALRGDHTIQMSPLLLFRAPTVVPLKGIDPPQRRRGSHLTERRGFFPEFRSRRRKQNISSAGRRLLHLIHGQSSWETQHSWVISENPPSSPPEACSSSSTHI
ncbi:hypothetical protein FKM82_005261 [Ascaphus truei]